MKEDVLCSSGNGGNNVFGFLILTFGRMIIVVDEFCVTVVEGCLSGTSSNQTKVLVRLQARCKFSGMQSTKIRD